eukprot:TRINITY_DN5755_c0_g1_i2.p1 TRINITY_DN5755_c0_g1~~TRINITY_DN5755_c0_g1_i2.p1  ORF type:complete len:760 (+),score=144.91 TRINITY_DN5755_c0_g1_i2:67-2346(+)
MRQDGSTLVNGSSLSWRCEAHVQIEQNVSAGVAEDFSPPSELSPLHAKVLNYLGEDASLKLGFVGLSTELKPSDTLLEESSELRSPISANNSLHCHGGWDSQTSLRFPEGGLPEQQEANSVDPAGSVPLACQADKTLRPFAGDDAAVLVEDEDLHGEAVELKTIRRAVLDEAAMTSEVGETLRCFVQHSEDDESQAEPVELKTIRRLNLDDSVSASKLDTGKLDQGSISSKACSWTHTTGMETLHHCLASIPQVLDPSEAEQDLTELRTLSRPLQQESQLSSDATFDASLLLEKRATLEAVVDRGADPSDLLAEQRATLEAVVDMEADLSDLQCFQPREDAKGRPNASRNREKAASPALCAWEDPITPSTSSTGPPPCKLKGCISSLQTTMPQGSTASSSHRGLRPRPSPLTLSGSVGSPGDEATTNADGCRGEGTASDMPVEAALHGARLSAEDEAVMGQKRPGGVEVVVESPKNGRSRLQHFQAQRKRSLSAQGRTKNQNAQRRAPSPGMSKATTPSCLPDARGQPPEGVVAAAGVASHAYAVGGVVRQSSGTAGHFAVAPNNAGAPCKPPRVPRVTVAEASEGAASASDRGPGSRPPSGASSRPASTGPSSRRSSSVGTGKRSSFGVQSNRKLVRNALEKYCLKGDANNEQREQVLRAVDEELAAYERLIILFRSIHTGRHDVRALYGYSDGSWRRVLQILPSPVVLEDKMVAQCLRYQSGGKEFKEVPALRESLSVGDAVFLHPQYLPKSRMVTS